MIASGIEGVCARIQKAVTVDIEVMTMEMNRLEENAVSPVLKPSRTVV